jgi:hypothetical protein
MAEIRNSYASTVGTPSGELPTGRLKRENNIKIGMEMELEIFIGSDCLKIASGGMFLE